METLPPELIRSIANFLPARSLLQFKIINKRTNRILKENEFWIDIVYRDLLREDPYYDGIHGYSQFILSQHCLRSLETSQLSKSSPSHQSLMGRTLIIIAFGLILIRFVLIVKNNFAIQK